jgi:hypothetical protein
MVASGQRTMVIDALDEIAMPGAFAPPHRVPADNLRLEVEGVGPIRFPVSKWKAALLCGVEPFRRRNGTWTERVESRTGRGALLDH